MSSSFQIESGGAGTSYRSGELQPVTHSGRYRSNHDPSTSYYIPTGSGYQSPPVYGQPPRPGMAMDEEAFKDKGLPAPPLTWSGRMERFLGLMDFTNCEVWRGTLVELVGFSAFQFALITGIAACVDFKQRGIAIALVYFLVWAACILAALSVWVGAGHLNPIFTYTTMLTGHTTAVRAMLYMAAQSLGALIGTLAAKQVVARDFVEKNSLAGCLLGEVVRTSRGLEWPEGLTPRAGLISEIFFTFLLIFVAYSTLLEPGNFRQTGPILAALSIGGAAGLFTFISSQLKSPYYSGAGMNPARCLGPAIVQGSTLWDCHWVFWAGPFIAGTIFGVVFRLVANKQPQMLTTEEEFYAPPPPQAVVPAPAPTPQEKRMDVFLHIKAMLHRSESERERSRSRSRNLVEEMPSQL
ncbi:aquaporin PIP2-3 [Selaginella moellendorffii]|nr:aquaporin PIP2-3 [Selaginella moellendorffii]|eukprot:XP_002967663.2 aquaporin PIP2-3 [Selaginella moellendorffii]